jgi:hypothetical protein
MVPDSMIEARVKELQQQIEKDFNDWRNHWLTGPAFSFLGFMRNHWKGFWAQSREGQARVVAPAVVRATFLGVNELKIPILSHLTSVVEYGVDKVIEHLQKKRLLRAFANNDLDADENKILQEQGEFVAVKLAKAINDAVRKLKQAESDASNARKAVKDCETFYKYLVVRHYFVYRFLRLDDYCNLLKEFVANLDAELTAINTAIGNIKTDDHNTAKEIIKDSELHRTHCQDQDYCLFKMEWIKAGYVSTTNAFGQTPDIATSRPPVPGSGGRPVPGTPPPRPGAIPLPWQKK